jgi:hypothetical protein
MEGLMPYSTNIQVNRNLGPHTVSIDTIVTVAEVDALRTETAAQIDAVLASLNVTLPITPGHALLAYLGAVESWGVTAQALKMMFPEAVGPGESPAWAFWQKKYDDALLMLRDGVGVYQDLSDIEEMVASSYFTNNPETEAELGQLAGAHLFEVDDLGVKPW